MLSLRTIAATPRGVPPVCLIVFLFAFAFAACGGPRRVLPQDSFQKLVDLQRTYAAAGASSDDWVALAQRFHDVGAVQPDAPYADDALAGEAIASFYADRRESDTAAVDALTELLSYHPESPHVGDALYWLAQAHQRLGSTLEARAAYTSLVQDHPSHPYAAAARHELAEQRPAVSNGARSIPEPAQRQERSSPADERIANGVRTVDRVPIPAGVRSLGQQLGLDVRTIVIDPGHGGKDPGAQGVSSIPEKQIALGVALEVARLLSADGFAVRMTRDSDVFVPLRERNAMAHEWNADLFLSLHVNEAENADAHGVETWVGAPAQDAEAAAVAARENLGAGTFSNLQEYLAELLAETKTDESRELARSLHTETVIASGARDRGIREAPFVVLLGLRVPSVLVELGFASNAQEAANLASPEYRRRLAHGVAIGVRDYVTALTYLP